jgi:hypothetical protein
MGIINLLADLPTVFICQTGGDVCCGKKEPKLEKMFNFCFVEREKYQLKTCGQFADSWQNFPVTTLAKNSAS